LAVEEPFATEEALCSLELVTSPIVQKQKGEGKYEVVHVHAMKAFGGNSHVASLILTSALDAGEWSPSRPGRFTPGE
jgi:hypothetical protein